MKLLSIFVVLFINYAVYTQKNPNRYRFSYQSKVFKGSKGEITTQLRTYKNSTKYIGIPEEIREELNIMFLKTKDQVYPRRYKKNAILFLDAINEYEEFLLLYDAKLYEVVRKLKRDINYIDFKLERQFTKSKVVADRTRKEDPTNIDKIKRLEKEFIENHTILLSHRWMRTKFDDYKTIRAVKNPDELMTEFKKKEAGPVFRLYQEKKIGKIKVYIENQIIDFYYKKAIAEMDPELFTLEYINKI